MVEDHEAILTLRVKPRLIMIFINKFIVTPHFYNEDWDNYRHLELQWLWFLFVYEYDRM
jgi:hypothetical protein